MDRRQVLTGIGAATPSHIRGADGVRLFHRDWVRGDRSSSARAWIGEVD